MLSGRRYWARFLLHLALGFLAGLLVELAFTPAASAHLALTCTPAGLQVGWQL